MRTVVQRVTSARVEIAGRWSGPSSRGCSHTSASGEADTDEDRAWVLGKLVGLRVFEDAGGKMGKSVQEVGGAILLVTSSRSTGT